MLKLTSKFFNYLLTAFLGLALLFLFAPAVVRAQEEVETVTKESQVKTITQEETTAVNKTAVETPKPKLEPVYRDYKGIRIGMKNDEVRDTLNNLKDKGEFQDFFVFSNNEMAQVFYDKEGMVRAVSVTYMGNLENAPTPMSIFGEDLNAKEDGSIYKMVSYPDAGYWVSYNRTGGNNVIVTITMQKM